MTPRLFSRFARWSSRMAGHAVVFAASVALVVVWAAAGPVFHFSDTWQLTINTLTTVVTFLMVFVIQNQQMRDTEAMQIKLDELLRATERASNAMLSLEDLPEEDLARIQQRYAQLGEHARRNGGGGSASGRGPVEGPSRPPRRARRHSAMGDHPAAPKAPRPRR